MKNKSARACIIVFQFAFTRLADHIDAYMKGLILKCLSSIFFLIFLHMATCLVLKQQIEKRVFILFIWCPFERVITQKQPLKTSLENRWSQNQRKKP